MNKFILWITFISYISGVFSLRSVCIRFCLHFQTDHSEIMVSGMFCLSEYQVFKNILIIRIVVYVEMKLDIEKTTSLFPDRNFFFFFHILCSHEEYQSRIIYIGLH